MTRGRQSGILSAEIIARNVRSYFLIALEDVLELIMIFCSFEKGNGRKVQCKGCTHKHQGKVTSVFIILKIN